MRKDKLEIQWIIRFAMHGVVRDNQYGRSELTRVAFNPLATRTRLIPRILFNLFSEPILFSEHNVNVFHRFRTIIQAQITSKNFFNPLDKVK